MGAEGILLPAAEGVGALWWSITAVALLAIGILAWRMLRLQRRLIHANLSLERSSEERLALTSQLDYLAIHDSLTHLPNRALLLDRMQQSIFASQRDEGLFAVLLLNLSGFRAINDSLGHSAGDQLLIQTAKRLERQLRKSDTLARLGADEFVVLVPNIQNRAQAAAKAHNLIVALQEPFAVDGQRVQITGHIGIAVFPEHADTGEALLRDADLAMETARVSEQTHAFYDSAQSPSASSRLALQSELRDAIEQRKIELYYQPIVDTASGQCVGLEALVRWHHPRLGLLLPEAFVPLAEQTGLILPLTLLTLERALQNAQTWHDEHQEVYLSLNVSPLAVLIPTFVPQAARVLDRLRAADQLLEFEITGGTVQNLAGSDGAAQRLTRLDVTLALDAFNSAHSSAHYLTALPISRIKVDRSLVESMSQNEGDVRLVKSTIRLAGELGLTTVAEGVETGDTFHTLRALGCDCVQGTYISPPLPADMVVGWLRESAWHASRVYA